MARYQNILETIGNTPLVKLGKLLALLFAAFDHRRAGSDALRGRRFLLALALAAFLHRLRKCRDREDCNHNGNN